MHKCVAHGRRICLSCAWITMSFPVEHFIWEKMPVFRSISQMLGL